MLAPFQGAQAKLELSPALVAPVLAPPPFAATLRALQRQNTGDGLSEAEVLGTLAIHPLPADLDRALSGLGQAALGAASLAQAGDAYAGAALVEAAIEAHRPTFEKYTILLAYPQAFSGLAWDAAATRAKLDAFLAARDSEAALAAAGLAPAAPIADPPALSAELAALAAKLDLPVDVPTRLAWAAEDGTPLATREPLRAALAHVLRAMDERAAARSALTAADESLLQQSGEVAVAALADPPSAAQLALLARYGRALSRLDEGGMLGAADDLLAARDALARASPAQGADARFGEGSLPVALALLHPTGTPRYDPATGGVDIVDANGTSILTTPPLANPDRDVLFVDPFGLVLVSGTGSTVTDESFGGRTVEAGVPDAPTTDPAGQADAILAALDARLADAPDGGVWPALSSRAHAALAPYEGKGSVPHDATFVVNPAGYQVLRWDAGGDDLYLTNAGGAGTRGVLAATGDGAAGLAEDVLPGPLPAALLVDAGGNDTYLPWGNDTAGSANGSVALLADLGGRDVFQPRAQGRVLASATAGGVAVLLHGEGDATFFGAPDSVASAAGDGTAILVASAGNDTYRGGNRSVAASVLGREAALVDLGGDDRYQGENLSLAASAGGLALLLDASGNDTYRGPATSEGYVPGDAGVGPARIAILADLGGRDSGACTSGTLSNAALGSAGVRASLPAPGAFDPAFGLCVASDLAPATPSGADVPPTYFVSSFGNFTLPGLARLGSLGDDVVPGPYVLDVDLLGNDTYGAGAVATVNATRAAALTPDLGYVGPVSILLDTDGDNLFDATLAPPGLGGSSGYADGGVAVQATLYARAAQPRESTALVDALGVSVSRADENATQLRDDLLASGTPDPSTQPAANLTKDVPDAGDASLAVDEPSGRNVFRGIDRGLGSAGNLGAALVLSEGYSEKVTAATRPDLACRMGCASGGATALVLSQGGPGDDVAVSPSSLGAATPGTLGALALYLHRGGTDSFHGSNESMGVVAAAPANPQERPTVALFVKDGWADDAYDPTMTAPGLAHAPRGNDSVWQDAAPEDALALPGERSLRVGMGVDNLDWYLNANLEAANRGVAPGVGPDDPLAPRAIPLAAPSTGSDGQTAGETIRWRGSDAANQSQAVFVSLGLGDAHTGGGVSYQIRKQSSDAANTTEGAGGNGGGGGSANATTPDARDKAPAQDPGSGGSLTGPYGVEPVTLARTAFSPIVHLTEISSPSATSFRSPHSFATVGDAVNAHLEIGNPPAYADATLLDPSDNATATGPRVAYSNATSRVELSVRGLDVAWTGCPIPEWRDRLDPLACLVRSWDRERDGAPSVANDIHPDRLGGNGTDRWIVLWDPTSGLVPGTDAPIFPPGAYALSYRVYAARSYGNPAAPYGVQDGVLNATLSDAFNYTDDSYGYYGTVASLRVLLFNAPHWGTAYSIVSSNGTAPATFSDGVTEPGVVTAQVTSLDDPTFLQTIRTATAFDGDNASLARVGHDYVNLTWHGESLPRGQYVLTLVVTGRTSQRDSLQMQVRVWVDDRAPPSVQDARAVPAVVNASLAPDGRFLVPVTADPDQISGFGSPVQRIHLWVQEDVLDPADPTQVLEHHAWRYAGVDASAPLQNVTLPDGSTEKAYLAHFPGDPRPGPPRMYRIAAYAEDNAGNVKVADPANATPEGPDCLQGVCAEYYYDITPPRTRLALVDPSPELSRNAGGSIRLVADAPETPDVSRIDVFALPVRPDQGAFLGAARDGTDPIPSKPPAQPNLTLAVPDAGPVVSGPMGLVEAGGTLRLALNLTDREKSGLFDAANANVQDNRPIWARVDVLGPDFAPIEDPTWVNVTAQIGGLSPGNSRLVALEAHAPAAPGLFVARATIDANLTDVNITATSWQGAFAAWGAVAQDADGSYVYAPDAPVDNESVLFVSRGVDLVGNVEDKVDYDARVDVDLTPPALAAPPTAEISATATVLSFSTTEPASVEATATDDAGNAITTRGAAGLDHELRLDGLTPGTRYTIALHLVDEVGNAADVPGPDVTTAKFLDVHAGTPNGTLAAPGNLTWNSNASVDQGVVYDLALSLDDGTSWSVNLTGAGLPSFESGSTVHSFPVDPTQLPESSRARLRVCARPADGSPARACDVSGPFVLDGQPPCLAVETNLSVYRRGPVVIALNATDGASGVEAIEGSRDNRTFQVLPGPFVLSGDAPTDVYVRARDRAGNVAPAQRLHVLLDGSPPEVHAQAPALTSGTAVPVLVSASDALSGLAFLDATADDGFHARVFPRELVGGVVRLSWTLGAREGVRTLCLTAVDAAGNAATTNITLLVDRTPPALASSDLMAGLVDARARSAWTEEVSLDALVVSADASIPLDAQPLARSHELSMSGLKPGTAYRLVLVARGAAGNPATVELPFRTAPDVTPPPAPARLDAEAEPDGTVALSWSAVVDDGGPVAYRVLREENGSFAPLRTTSSTFALDDTAAPDLAYRYRIVAVDGSGNVGAASPIASATPHAPVHLLAREARLEGATFVVTSRFDADPRVPVVAVVEGRRVPMARDGDAYVARLPALPSALGATQGWHVEAGTLRDPAVGEARLPLVPAESTSGSPVVGALRAAPAPLPWLALAAALVLLGRRRS